MNYMDQQQFIMQQGQRMQTARMMTVPSSVPPQHMHRQQRYGMPIMQPGQQTVHLGPGQYVQNPQMQPRLLGDALARLPPEVQQMAQQQINAEPNNEKKRQIAMSFIQGHRVRQVYQGQTSMGANQMVVMGQQGSMQTGNAQMVRMSGVQGTAIAYSTPSGNMQSGIPQMQSTQITVQRLPGHGYITVGPQGIQTYQQQDVSNLPAQQNTITQPSSVGPAVQTAPAIHLKGPSSVPSAIYGQHHVDGAVSSHGIAGAEDRSAEEPLYNQKLELLKPYHEHIKKIIERHRLDGQAPKSKYERLLEVMENRRKVDLKLLEKCVVSVRSIVERDSLCFSAIDALRAETTDVAKTSLPDSWGELQQSSCFRVPEDVEALISTNKRVQGDGPPAKRVKKEETLMNEPLFEARISVMCLDGSNLELSTEASDQLRTYEFSIEPQPISSDCAEVHLLIKNRNLDIPPLRLVVPVKYPESGASICRDRWAFGGRSLSDVNIQFEKRLNMIPNSKSILEVVNAWKLASEHVLKVGTTSDDDFL